MKGPQNRVHGQHSLLTDEELFILLLAIKCATLSVISDLVPLCAPESWFNGNAAVGGHQHFLRGNDRVGMHFKVRE